jgi:hypothetical protein
VKVAGSAILITGAGAGFGALLLLILACAITITGASINKVICILFMTLNVFCNNYLLPFGT